MQASAAPPPTWVRFTRSGDGVAHDGDLVDRYRVDSVTTVRGAPLSGIEPGARLARIESTRGIPAGGGDLVGVTQHLGYTRASERAELVSGPAGGASARVIVIPISKSAAWWALAHDERDRLFRGATHGQGHVNVGRPHAPGLFRKLYHGRGVPGAGWDFLTYFEVEPAMTEGFQLLLRGLRDPEQNPEWQTVERESEIWLTKER